MCQHLQALLRPSRVPQGAAVIHFWRIESLQRTTTFC
jgi:hypothetical protein